MADDGHLHRELGLNGPARHDPLVTTLLAALFAAWTVLLLLRSAPRPSLTFARRRLVRKEETTNQSDTETTETFQDSANDSSVNDDRFPRTFPPQSEVVRNVEKSVLSEFASSEPSRSDGTIKASNSINPLENGTFCLNSQADVSQIVKQLLTCSQLLMGDQQVKDCSNPQQTVMESLIETKNALCLWGTFEEDDFNWKVACTNYSDWNQVPDSDHPEDGEYFETLSEENNPTYPQHLRNLLEDYDYFGSEGSTQMEFYVNTLTSEADSDIANPPAERDASEGYRPFPFLETIIEETAEELQLDQEVNSDTSSPSCSSGHWGWGWGWLNSDDDSGSVIHVPLRTGSQTAGPQSPSRAASYGVYGDGFGDDPYGYSTSPISSESDWSERDQEVPKKKRRLGDSDTESTSSSGSDDVRILAETVIGDNEVFENSESRSPSVTESLIQFEALEKEIDLATDSEDVFHSLSESSLFFETSATSEPFEDRHSSLNSAKEFAIVYESQTPPISLDSVPGRKSPEPNLVSNVQGNLSLRSWSSADGLQLRVHEEPCRRRSASDVAIELETKREKLQCWRNASGPESFFMVMGNCPTEAQGEFAVENSLPWRMSSEIIDTNEDETQEDWEPDGYLGSEDEGSPRQTSSDSDDYAAECSDHFSPDFHFSFKNLHNSTRMRSFRSFDSLHLLASEPDESPKDRRVHTEKSLHFIRDKACENDSLESHKSNSSSERSSPESDTSNSGRISQRTDRRRLFLQRSVEALSEDSGYGDATGLLHSPNQSGFSSEETCEKSNQLNTPTPREENNDFEITEMEVHETRCRHDSAQNQNTAVQENKGQEEVDQRVILHDTIHLKQSPLQQLQPTRSDVIEPTLESDSVHLAPEMSTFSTLLLRRNPKTRPAPLSLKEAEEFLHLDSSFEEIPVCDGNSEIKDLKASGCAIPSTQLFSEDRNTLREISTENQGISEVNLSREKTDEKYEIEDGLSLHAGSYERSKYSLSEEQHERRVGVIRGGLAGPLDFAGFSQFSSQISCGLDEDVTCCSRQNQSISTSSAPEQSCWSFQRLGIVDCKEEKDFSSIPKLLLDHSMIEEEKTENGASSLNSSSEQNISRVICQSSPNSFRAMSPAKDSESLTDHADPKIQLDGEYKCEDERLPISSESESDVEAKQDDANKKLSKKEKQPLLQRFSLARLSARMSSAFNRSEPKRSTESLNPKSAASSETGTEPRESSQRGRSKDKESHSSETTPKQKQKNFFSRKFYVTSSQPPTIAKQSTSKTHPAESHPLASSPATTSPTTTHPGSEKNNERQVVVDQTEATVATVAPNAGNRVGNDEQVASVTTAEDSGDVVFHETASRNSNAVGSSATLPFSAKPPVPLPRSLGKPPLPPLVKPRVTRKSCLASDTPPEPVVSNAAVQQALDHFREVAKQDRQRLAKSVPDFVVMDEMARCAAASPGIDRGPSTTISAAPVRQDANGSADSRNRARQAALSRAVCVESAWNATLSKAVRNLSRGNLSGSGILRVSENRPSPYTSSQEGLLETSFDDTYETNLDDLIKNLENLGQTCVEAQNHVASGGDKKFRSMLNLGATSAPSANLQNAPTKMDLSPRVPDANRAKSMEFLLDDHNKTTIQPPENELKKSGERQMSEHELRVQRSLQRLNVPDWFKQSRPQMPSSAQFVRRREQYGSIGLGSSSRPGGWSGLSSDVKTLSMSSLGSSSRCATPTRVIIPTRVRAPSDWRQVKSSRESLTSPASSICSTVVSPSISCSSPQDSTRQSVFSWSGSASTSAPLHRWGSGRSSASPVPSYRSTLGPHRQPYLGWRSQEKLNSTGSSSSLYQSPAERLAQTVKKTPAPSLTAEESAPGTNEAPFNMAEVRSSISEVTSAIVHYVTENASRTEESTAGGQELKLQEPRESQTPSPRRQRCVWMESSFVGAPSKTIREPSENCRVNKHVSTSDIVPARSDIVNHAKDGSKTLPLTNPTNTLPPHPSTATLEDVLNSLLGLPSEAPHRGLRRPISQPAFSKSRNGDLKQENRSFSDLRTATSSTNR